MKWIILMVLGWGVFYLELKHKNNLMNLLLAFGMFIVPAIGLILELTYGGI